MNPAGVRGKYVGDVMSWNWFSPQTFSAAKAYTCGFCNLAVSSDKGYAVAAGVGGSPHPALAAVFICPNCREPSYITESNQVPGIAYGASVANLPPDVKGLYDEARNCMAVNANTASVLAARKLLMNVSAAQGAAPGESFQFYVKYLHDNGYVPPKARGWIDHIRKRGNEATHEIPPIGRKDAEELITFVEMILKLVYDYPARVPSTP